MVHLAGGGILSDTLSMYALILSRCFSQKCCTVSLMGYGSNTLILWFGFELLLLLFPLELLELIIVTLVLFARRDVTVTGPSGFVPTDTGPEVVWSRLDPLGELVITETCPSAVFECWMETDGTSASDDLPDVKGFTDIDCV